MSTLKAPLGRGIPLVNFDKRSPIPSRFVFQLPDKLTPSHVTDSLCQARVFDHVLDLQTLHAHHLVFADQACRKLVLVITASISNASVYPGNVQTGLRMVLTLLFLSDKATWGLCRLLYLLVAELGIADRLTSGQDHHGFQAQIQPNLGVDHRQRLDLFL